MCVSVYDCGSSIYEYVFGRLCMCAAVCLCSRFYACHTVHSIWRMAAAMVVERLLCRSVLPLGMLSNTRASTATLAVEWLQELTVHCCDYPAGLHCPNV